MRQFHCHLSLILEPHIGDQNKFCGPCSKYGPVNWPITACALKPRLHELCFLGKVVTMVQNGQFFTVKAEIFSCRSTRKMWQGIICKITYKMAAKLERQQSLSFWIYCRLERACGTQITNPIEILIKKQYDHSRSANYKHYGYKRNRLVKETRRLHEQGNVDHL